MSEPSVTMATKIAPCKFCGEDIEWWQYGQAPRDPTTKAPHKCNSKTTTAASDSSSNKIVESQQKTTGPNLSRTPSQEKEHSQHEVMIDWMNLINLQMTSVKNDLDLSIMYSKITMRALYFLCEEMEKAQVIGSVEASRKKEMFNDPIEMMEKKLNDRKDTNVNPSN